MASSICLAPTALAQDKARSAAPEARTEDLAAYLCKDVMRLTGEDRNIAIGALHGYFLGKKGATIFVPATLSKATDEFTEYCLDHPSEKALQAFARFVK
ncbi:MAG TPA: HdeA/HdeB family chaperone [Afifellaceae bacterium]|nr:HdeA/HdeB family chaperone [Afifellaceae bacterium]